MRRRVDTRRHEPGLDVCHQLMKLVLKTRIIGSRPLAADRSERSGTGPYIMTVFAALLLCVSATVGEDSTAVTPSRNHTELPCHDRGMRKEPVRVLKGEAGWLSCPLLSHPTCSNCTPSNGVSLVWYHLPPEQDIEQPIRYSQRVSKVREKLWLQPANEYDTGLYICTLRNRTSCTKVSMTLEVLSLNKSDCNPLVAVAPIKVKIPFNSGQTLTCPDIQAVTKMAERTPSVTWYHKCRSYPFWDIYREVKGNKLTVHQMGKQFEGQYYCRVHYSHRNFMLNFTRAFLVSAVSQTPFSKMPVILNPNEERQYTVRLGMEVKLDCQAFFPYLEDGSWSMWWTVDGRPLDPQINTRFSQTNQSVKEEHGDLMVERGLVIKEVQKEDLRRAFNCSVRNKNGTRSMAAQLRLEAYSPSVELGCGLGGILMLMLVLFVVYHVFWLELLLLYRSWFGTDERYTDEKEFDVYISYVRDGEEEQFVVSTLREVLENHLGYSVCIFDRDSLPGGTITDETLSFVGRSRRLLVVLSPGFASRGSQALLELKAGMDHMALGGHLRVILVQYRPLRWKVLVGELRRARVVLALLRWRGDESKELNSRFWKRLLLELPLQRTQQDSGSGTSRAFRSQNSTSSQTGLLSPGAVNKAQYNGGKL